MSILLAICAVICTVGFSLIVVAIIRAQRRFEVASYELAKTAEAVRITVVDMKTLSMQIEQIASSVELPLRRAAFHVGDVGDRAARLSHVVLDEVEGPIRTTIAMLVGLRTGTRSLLAAWSRRSRRSDFNGGYSNE